MSYPFLSPEWISAAQEIRSEYQDRVEAPALELSANVVITDAPFDDSEIRGYVDSSPGGLSVELGELDEPEIVITLPYEVAHTLFVGRKAEAVMEAFLRGRILVEGDVSKILQLQVSADAKDDPLAREVAARIDAITD
jgi:hypothetical protein